MPTQLTTLALSRSFTRQRPSRRASALALLALAGLSAACSSDASSDSKQKSAAIELGEFKSAAAPQADAASGARAIAARADTQPSAAPALPSVPSVPAAATEGTRSATRPKPLGVLGVTGEGVPVLSPQAIGADMPTTAVPMEPIGRITDGARPVGNVEIVESLVGQINGKPVFAGEFLRPLDKRLAAEAASSKTAREWVDKLNRIAGETLDSQVKDELLLSEARASLTKEERAGLFTLISKLRENLTTTAEGSQELANERLLAEEGKTLEQKATDERDRILIRTLVGRYIQPRLNVSWRDIQREYAKSADKYNPPPIVTLRMIWVPKAEQARIEQVKSRLAAGESFETLAKDRAINDFNAGDAGLVTKAPIQGNLAQAKLLTDPKLNERAVNLKAGQVDGPIESGNRAVFIFLQSIEQERGKTLEEVQLELGTLLREKKFAAELRRFYERLLERGSKTDISLMTERLLLIAVDRYSGRIGTGRPSAPSPSSSPSNADGQPPAPAPAPATPSTPAGPNN